MLDGLVLFVLVVSVVRIIEKKGGAEVGHETRKEAKEGKEEKCASTKKAKTAETKGKAEKKNKVQEEVEEEEEEEEEEEVRTLGEYLADPDHHVVRPCWLWYLTYDEGDDGVEELEPDDWLVDDAYIDTKTDNEHIEEMIEWIRESAARGFCMIASQKRRAGWRLSVTLSNTRRGHMRKTWVWAGLAEADHLQRLRLVRDNIPVCYRIG